MLTHLTVPATLWRDIPAQVANVEGSVCVSLRGGSTSTMLGAVANELRGPIGVWLDVSEQYPASIGARDVKTLAQLCHVDCVVVASNDQKARQHAQIVEALLSGERVTLGNDVAVLDGCLLYTSTLPTLSAAGVGRRERHRHPRSRFGQIEC